MKANLLRASFSQQLLLTGKLRKRQVHLKKD